MYAVVDIETTGLRGDDNKITEISIFVFDGEKVVKEFTSLVNPEVSINYRISQLTGITDNMVRTAPKFYEIAQEVLEYTEGCIFVAHNVNFDYNIIKEELTSLGAEFKRKKLCTVRLSRKLIQGQQSYSLGALCTSLGITIHSRHRARGDAEATVILLKKLLDLDKDGIFESFLNPKSRQATLPPLLPKAVIDALPNTTGVYYFKDVNGKIIYVGKAKDIKQRVLSHIYSKTNKEQKLCFETADIVYTETGSELVALLLESDEIKKQYPKHNRAQKRVRYSYGVGTYIDRKGILHIVYNKLTALQTPLFKFYNQTECRAFLEKLCEEYELCPRYCNLQQITGACFHYHIKSCKGVCRDLESIAAYNERALEALRLTSGNVTTYLIKDTGRDKDERAIVLIENGIYQGFGYVKAKKRIATLEEYAAHITPKQDNTDVQKIIKSYLRQNKDNESVSIEN